MGLTTKFITNQVYYQQSIHAAIAHDRANHSPPGVEVEYSQHSCATVTLVTAHAMIQLVDDGYHSQAVRAGDYFIFKLKFLLYGHVMYILIS